MKNKFRYVLIFSMFVLFLTCGEKKDTKKNLPFTLFSTVPASTSGVNFLNKLHYTNELNIIDYLYYYNGGGVAIGDIDNDGLDDIFLTANQLPDKLYRNKGNFEFEDISGSAGISTLPSWSTGVTMADLNNDGLLDIHVSKVGLFNVGAHNEVYINQGDAKFIESSKEIGLNFTGYSTQSAFLDYDKDGDLDMYLLNHSVHTTRSYGKISERLTQDTLSGDRFYENKLNEGQLFFEDVTQKSGIYSSILGYGLGINASDINGDGLTDIYVSNDFHENDYLYINTGIKSFVEQSSIYLQHTSRFSMGMDVGDINGDQLPDLVTLDMMPYDPKIFLKSGGEDSDKVSQIKKSFGYQDQYARNTIQINNGNGFSDIALMTETHATDWSWSALIQDFDNDGKNDVFITNGIFKRPNDLDYINYISTDFFKDVSLENMVEVKKQLIAKMPSLKIPNILFKNEGNYKFKKLTYEVGLEDSFSNGAAYSDLDNDGDLDLVINNLNEPATLLRNNTSSQEKKGNYLNIDLRQNNLLPNVAESKVTIYCGKQKWVKQVSATRGFQSASTQKLHFGIGNENKVDSIQILWPDNTIQTSKNIVINTTHKIEKTQSATKYEIQLLTVKNNLSKFPYVHVENDYLDYVREPLMPEKLSTEGPAVVYEDLDNDGFKDLFIGGARYQRPVLFKGNNKGHFEQMKVSAFSADEKYEDVDAIAFDLENDGDLDLYVQSGGNDYPEGDPFLEDRMYINNGKGNFQRLKSPLPSTNGACLAAGDYNNDGFIDLFIGSRSIPGSYGNSPVSLILKNTGNSSFTVVVQDELGMITDAEWTDLNNDGFLDLIYVGDWMDIGVLLNKKDGTFKYESRKLGLNNTSGLWNVIEIIDIDNNGFKDIVAGNVGENFKWKASSKKPVKLFLSDFDNNGQQEPIIFYPYFDKYVPFANRETLKSQLPYLAKRFKNNEEFSEITTIEDLTGKNEKNIDVKKEIHELRSMIFLNNGDSLLGFPFDKTVQQSTVQDIIAVNERLYYVGNYSGFVAELGDCDANPGGVLANFNSNTFAEHISLNLPQNLDYRKIIHLENQTFLIIANNGIAYIYKEQP